MQYTVRPGDTLWRIATSYFGDATKWTTIAEDNRLLRSARLYVGDVLVLRDSLLTRSRSRLGPPGTRPIGADQLEHKSSVIPARAFLYVLADEIDPTRPKLVRKVMVSPKMAERVRAHLGRPVNVVANPELFGLSPKGPGSTVSKGRHVMGMTQSRYLSSSKSSRGAPRFSGSPFWIDVNKARAAGATFHDTSEILADLDRIRSKMRRAEDLEKVDYFKRLVAGDAEVLIEGRVLPSAVKSATSMAVTRGLQGVQVVGFVMTAVDLGQAAVISVETGSLRPIAAETTRQAGGWATAWGGAQLGALTGAAFGIETGPGAILTGAAGAVIGGFAGYMGFDWVADHIYEN
jgi:hypothetical protein